MSRARISLFSQSLFALDLLEAIEATAALGFDAIELACCKPHFDLEMARRDPERVLRAIERSGLAVSALSTFSSYTDPRTVDDELAAAETFIRLAPTFGTQTVKVNPGPPGSALATPAHWRCLERALAELIPLAREIGVRLAFETHMRQLTDTLASAKRLMTLAPADVVGLTVDYSNLVFAGDDLEQVVADLGERTYNTHLKNGTIDAAGGWCFHPLDVGWTDYAVVLGALCDGGYDGPLTLECLGPDAREHPLRTAQRDREILVRLLRQTGWDIPKGMM
ncbi:MAG: sugar phosphate isomerase/epimerase [Anaerolineae bacterium]|nr:sugar phosphate isomerase/epimerase [Anaerolineae bacterium]